MIIKCFNSRKKMKNSQIGLANRSHVYVLQYMFHYRELKKKLKKEN